MEIIAEKYEMNEKVGQGGSASVYKAWNKALKCYVAVKIYEGKQRLFMKERELMKELRHPAFPIIMDFIDIEEKIYLIMEYIDGMNLEDYVEKYGAVEAGQAVVWAEQMTEALAFLHKRSEPIIYQDMKPANIMIDKQGEIKLVDLGSAFLKYQVDPKEYMFTGTYGYAAPEQFEPRAWERVDERSDIYGLGVVIHFMLTGNNPSIPPYLLRPVRSYNAALPKELERVVERAVMPEQEKRYQNIQQMKEALKMTMKKEKRTRRVYQSAAFIYYSLLFGMAALFFGCYGKNGIENERALCIITGFIFILCLVKELYANASGGRNRMVRPVKNVYLSVKKGKGLLSVIICVILSGILLSMIGVKAAKEEILPVVVRNGEGRKILIRSDAFYCPRKTMRCEIPADSFMAGEEYILRLECVNRRTKESRSRTFFLKGPES